MCYLRELEYERNHSTQLALRFFRGLDSRQGTLENMVGQEFNIHCALEVMRCGHKPILEVPIKDTQVDVQYNDVAIECKAVKNLAKTKVLKQIKKYKTGNYKKVIVYVLKDTIVSEGMRKELERQNVEIVRADITKKELVDTVLGMIKIGDMGRKKDA